MMSLLMIFILYLHIVNNFKCLDNFLYIFTKSYQFIHVYQLVNNSYFLVLPGIMTHGLKCIKEINMEYFDVCLKMPISKITSVLNAKDVFYYTHCFNSSCPISQNIKCLCQSQSKKRLHRKPSYFVTSIVGVGNREGKIE